MKLVILTLSFLVHHLVSASTKSPSSSIPQWKIADATTCFNDEKLPAPTDLHLVTGPCDWSREDLLQSPYWGIELSDTDLQEIKQALAFCKAPGSGLELQDGWQPLGVTPTNFPLYNLAKKLQAMGKELEYGTGAVMIKVSSVCVVWWYRQRVVVWKKLGVCLLHLIHGVFSVCTFRICPSMTTLWKTLELSMLE
jgi:hypothetical protein